MRQEQPQGSLSLKRLHSAADVNHSQQQKTREAIFQGKRESRDITVIIINW